uniref:SH2 domain-containing protein n=1 Tax=Panagrellus redivivus TaxID=6233 RepID=A0A7E4VF07_PANRE
MADVRFGASRRMTSDSPKGYNNVNNATPTLLKTTSSYRARFPDLAAEMAESNMKSNRSSGRKKRPPLAASTTAALEELKGWYHGKMDRDRATSILVKDGDFLVRLGKSVTDLAYKPVLSVKNGPRHYHFLIKERFGLFWIEGAQFTSIAALLKYYWQAGRPVTINSGVVLGRPILSNNYNPAMARTERDMRLESSNSAESPPNLVTVTKSISYALFGENAPYIMSALFKFFIGSLVVTFLYFCAIL